MRMVSLLLLLGIFCRFPNAGPAGIRVEPKQEETGYQTNIYFEYAEKAANWLKGMAVQVSPDGYKWPAADDSSRFTPGIDTGAAGVGLFFLEMYKVTKNVEYLQYAEGAGRYLLNFYYTDGQVDWLNGAAGAGDYLIDLWNVTGNVSYLDEAKRIGQWLMTQHSRENGGYYWVNYINPNEVYTGFAHGTAGIGYFLAKLYAETNDAGFLEFARKAAAWLFSRMWEPEPGHYSWPRLTSDRDANSTWCGGSVGILLFLFQLYDSTGDNTYFNYIKGGIDWLVAQARNGGDNSYKWSYGDNSYSYPFAYCHGTPSVVHVLYEMHRRTGNSLYLDYARGGARWLQMGAERIDDNVLRWPHIANYSHDTGLLVGTAGVANAFDIFYSYDRDNSYLDYARSAAHWLMSAAAHPNFTQAKWINYVDAYDQDYGEKKYETAWYEGTAGIGLFFLSLSQQLPAPPEGNQPPVLSPIGNKKGMVRERLAFYLSAHDADQDPLVLVAGNLPAGAQCVENYFAWTPGADQAGTHHIYFIVTDGWDADWEQVEVVIAEKVKKVKIKR